MRIEASLSTYHKVHLTTVFVRQQKQPQNVLIRDLVVKGLAVQINKIDKELDIVAAARRHAIQLGQRANRVALASLLQVSLGQHALDELGRSVCGVLVVHIRRNVETNLHEGHRGVLVLMKLQHGLVLARRGVGHVLERNLKGGLVVDLEAERVALEAGLAPVPALHGHVHLLDGLLHVPLGVVLELLEIGLGEAVEFQIRAVLEHHLEAVALRAAHPVHLLDVLVLNLLRLVGLLVLEGERARLKLELTVVLLKCSFVII
jgi:hypothetical protein